MSKYGVPLRRSSPLRLADHPGTPTVEDWHAWAARQERPLAIDLFSGAGGLTLGLEAAGYRVALAVDVNPWALETHRHNFPGMVLREDLGDPEVRDRLVGMLHGLDLALVAGGPPCQPYSRAGRSKIRSLVRDGIRDPLDRRRELWQAFLDVVERVSPRAVLLENVPDMALGDDFAVVRLITERLEARGYQVDYALVDTADYGVPQHRQRLIILARRDGHDLVWPAVAERVTLRDAIGDLPPIDPASGDVGQERMPYGGPDSDFQRRARKGSDGEDEDAVFDHVTRPVRPDDLLAYQQMTSATRYSDLPEELRRYRHDIFNDKYKRLAWDELCRSITAHIAKDGYWYIHPRDHRTLTVREAARIQTFPDDFRFAGSRSHQYTQIGNAVPPALAEHVGAALLAKGTSGLGPSAVRARTTAALDGWAAEDSRRAPWAYPSRDAWKALVGIVIPTRRETWPTPAEVLKRIPTLAHATPSRLAVLEAMADDGSSRRAVVRLAQFAAVLRAAAETSPAREREAWARLSLSPAERMWLDTLALDEFRVSTSAPVLRVVARLTGTDIDQQRRLSRGRTELAKLIGGPPDGARRNAALHRLGTVLCTADTPRCDTCPLTHECRSYRG